MEQHICKSVIVLSAVLFLGYQAGYQRAASVLRFDERVSASVHNTRSIEAPGWMQTEVTTVSTGFVDIPDYGFSSPCIMPVMPEWFSTEGMGSCGKRSYHSRGVDFNPTPSGGIPMDLDYLPPNK